MGGFARIIKGLAAADPEPKKIMIDATYLKAHRTAASLRLKKGARPTDRPEFEGQKTIDEIVFPRTGGMNIKLHAVTDALGGRSGRLKDWRHIVTRYDRCLKGFLSATALAATIMFWL
ncbi:hypothetical protein SAMN04487971_11010 [Paracoccus chinensis]|uniref:Transposase DDE domain-containing protein n=1 Tax=Paracoccus chinensis TaxID=525640 RepID=A0A1G9JQA5_9RHOB|nr:hypothetical protein SAMN04487971_11010 [Paracoccus chinensis]